MAMFLNKFRRTSAAMFWGWVVCNLVTFLVLALWLLLEVLVEGGLAGGCTYLIFYTTMALIYSGIACVVAWLVVLLPVDLLVSASSWLRSPVPAAVCGAFGGFFGFAALLLALNFAAPDWTALPWLAAFGALAATTGLTASLHLVVKRPRQLGWTGDHPPTCKLARPLSPRKTPPFKTMFGQKFHRTADAMFSGWLRCTVLTCPVLMLWLVQAGGLLFLFMPMASAAYSGVAMFFAWLFILLPAELLISETSKLRTALPAAVLGMCASLVSLLTVWCGHSFATPRGAEAVPWLAAYATMAVIVGMTTARQLVRHPPRSQHTSP